MLIYSESMSCEKCSRAPAWCVWMDLKLWTFPTREQAFPSCLCSHKCWLFMECEMLVAHARACELWKRTSQSHAWYTCLSRSFWKWIVRLQLIYTTRRQRFIGRVSIRRKKVLPVCHSHTNALAQVVPPLQPLSVCHLVMILEAKRKWIRGNYDT